MTYDNMCIQVNPNQICGENLCLDLEMINWRGGGAVTGNAFEFRVDL